MTLVAGYKLQVADYDIRLRIEEQNLKEMDSRLLGNDKAVSSVLSAPCEYKFH